MATVKVRRVRSTNPITKEPIYYVQTKSTGTMSTSDLIDNIVREGQIPRIYAQGVLDYLTTAIFDYMKAGLSVQVPGLGTFKINVKSKAQATEAEATARTITGTKLQLIPFEKTKEEMRQFKFQMVDETVEEDTTGEEDEVPTNPSPGPGPTVGTAIPVTFKYQNNTEVVREYYVGQRVTEADAPEHAEGMAWKYLPFTMPEVEGIVITDCPEYDVEDYRKITIRWKDSAAGINVEQEYSIGEIVEAPEPPAGKHWDTDIIGKPAVPMRVTNIFAVAD